MVISACQPLIIPIEFPTATTQSENPTPEPFPTDFAPVSTPTFSPERLNEFLSQEEAQFIADHEIKCGDEKRPVVMMTYDDNAKYADVRRILDVFNKHHASATFFFIGEKITYSAKAVRAIISEGHLFGCHGWEHIDLTKLSDDQVNRQISRCFDALNEISPGYRMRFIRFPFGNGISNPRLLRIAAGWGMQHVAWTMGSGGMDRYTKDNIFRNVKNGSIVLSHMFRPFDVEQAEEIVSGLIDRGFTLETVETGRRLADMYLPAGV
jgi:peptidoglycan/xylan/chitin deacetylase (PgdA/CDA1 family)